VKNGDRIRLSVKDRCLDLMVAEAEQAKRREGLKTPHLPERGYARLYNEHILQADAGCDFDFLRG
jgi:dihydroxy-acid dehydratase